MNRTTWGAVLITVLVLAGAGFASRLSWRSGAVLIEQSRAVATRGGETLGRTTGALASWSGAWNELPGPARAGAVAGAALLLALALAVRRHRKQPHRLALRMLRRGGASPGVARRTGLSRDAIRALAYDEDE